MANTLKFGNGEWYGKKDTILAYNDENNNYKPLPFDFSRASSATVINKDGLIKTVGANEPRVDYKDSTDGAMLLEPSRSNIFDYSSDLSAWSKLNSTVTESSVLSLDGINNSYAYEKSSSSPSYIYRTVSLANTTIYTLSFFAKSGTSTNVRTDIWDTTQSTQCQIQVDLVTKTVSNFIGTSYEIKDYTNGWMRISVTFTSESSFGTTFNRYFNIDSVGSELYIWGAQLEEGSYATSYIPTQGSAVTRSRDLSDTQNLSHVIGQTEGVIFYDAILVHKSTSTAEDLFELSIDDGSSNNAFFINNYNNRLSVILKSGGSTSFTNNSFNSTEGARYKLGFAYKQNDFALYINGNQIATDSSGTVPTMNQITFGNYYNNQINLSNSVKVNNLKLYNTRLSNAELQALTQV